MSKAIVPSTISRHMLLLAAMVMLQYDCANSLNIGGFKLNFGGPKVASPEASKEFLSLQGVQVQSVTTGAFVDCDQLLNSKSKGSTLLVVNKLSYLCACFSLVFLNDVRYHNYERLCCRF